MRPRSESQMPHGVSILSVMPLFIARVTVGRLKPVSSASCGIVADSRRRRYPLTARKFERRTEEISDFSCIKLLPLSHLITIRY